MDKETHTPDIKNNSQEENQEGKKQGRIIRSERKSLGVSEKIADLVKSLIEAIKDLPPKARFPAFIAIAFIVLTALTIPLLNDKTDINVYVVFGIFLLSVVSSSFLTGIWKPRSINKSKQRELSSFHQQQAKAGLKRFAKTFETLASTPARRKKVRLIIPIVKLLPNEDGIDEKELTSKLSKLRDSTVEQAGAQNVVNQAINIGFLTRSNGRIFIRDEWNKVRIKAICFVIQEGAKIESRGWPDAPPTGKNWWDSDWDEVLIHITHIAGSEINKKIFVYLADPRRKKAPQYRASLQLLRRIIGSDAPIDSKAAVELIKLLLDQIIDLLPKS